MPPPTSRSRNRLLRLDYYALAICSVFFVIEVMIAWFFRNPFVRYFLGDVFVVVLIGYFI